MAPRRTQLVSHAFSASTFLFLASSAATRASSDVSFMRIIIVYENRFAGWAVCGGGERGSGLGGAFAYVGRAKSEGQRTK